MIYYVCSEKHPYTVRRFLKGWGRSLAPTLRILSWEQTQRWLRGGSLRRRIVGGSLRKIVNAAWEARRRPRPIDDLATPPTGHWIFSDLERLDRRGREEGAMFRDALVAKRSARSLHNDPLRTMGRYELLRTLHEHGVNDFDVYRLTEARRPRRYPVFLRTESDHAGAESALLPDEEAFEGAVEELLRSGRSREGRLVVEFLGERDERGLFRKYSAWRIGSSILPGHLFFGPDWMLKEPKVVDAESLRLEAAYLDENPHADMLDAAFRLGRIDYGRVDYGVVGGRVQVYEINTNPGIPSAPAPGPGALRGEIDAAFTERVIERFRALDAD